MPGLPGGKRGGAFISGFPGEQLTAPPLLATLNPHGCSFLGFSEVELRGTQSARKSSAPRQCIGRDVEEEAEVIFLPVLEEPQNKRAHRPGSTADQEKRERARLRVKKYRERKKALAREFNRRASQESEHRQDGVNPAETLQELTIDLFRN